MIISPPNSPLGERQASRDRDDEAGHEAAQVEPPIEAVDEGAQIVRRVLAVLEGMMRARQRRLEIAEDGVDPLELGRLTRLAAAHDDGQVPATGVEHAGEAPQAIADGD